MTAAVAHTGTRAAGPGNRVARSKRTAVATITTRPAHAAAPRTNAGTRRAWTTSSASAAPVSSSQARVERLKNAQGWLRPVSRTEAAKEIGQPTTISSATAARRWCR